MNDERLAAYLSGDLEPDEHAETTAALAGDSALRARADRIAAADRALAELSDVALPEGFSERLRAGIRADLDAVLGDELAARRLRRTARARWAMAGAAAAVVAVVGVGVVLTDVGGRDDVDVSTATGDAAGTLESGEAGALMAPSEGALPAPQVVALGRTLTDDDLRELASSGQFTAAARSSLNVSDADEVAERTQDQLTAYTAEAPAPAGDVRGGVADEPQEDGAVDLSAVSACLPVVVESAEDPLVPMYVELATYDGEDVVVFVMLAPRGDSDEMNRVEVWVLTVDGCQTRYFTQQDG